jgi:hypothetical protein
MQRIITLLIFVSTLSITSAEAALVVTSPATACALLNNIGLATGGWKNRYDNEFGCSSPYKEVGTGFPLANNLAYYPEGDRNTVAQLRLVLNVNNKSQAASGHSSLLSATDTLSEKAAGLKLPQSIKKAITKGNPIKIKLGQASVEVKRDNWPSGKGYEIHVIFK